MNEFVVVKVRIGPARGEPIVHPSVIRLVEDLEQVTSPVADLQIVLFSATDPRPSNWSDSKYGLFSDRRDKTDRGSTGLQ
jgi:hypothetical protein